ncbi:hypothetical protein PHMEG_00030405 [Phytophthora megakarya]|uniref:Uncharacterized protein n=1 Tax=Phytophthora megakarya TaxID=4795 RepID=A0A225UYU6_9STRA|nr:hypothetical protein PHMEG_00030405 [Phytophthora megakarya]
MVRVPRSSDDSEFHRESQEEVQVRTEQGNEMSSDSRSTTTSLNARSADWQSARRNSVDGSEADLDLEEKPQPPQVSGTEIPADLGSRQDTLKKQTKVKADPFSFIDSDKPTLYMPKDMQVSGSEVGKPRSKTERKKVKAPDDDEDKNHHRSSWSEKDMKSMYHHKKLRDFMSQDPVMRILKLKWIADPKKSVTAPATLSNRFDSAMGPFCQLKEAGIVPGSFDADALFDLDLNVIQATRRTLFEKLKILVGEVLQSPYPLPWTTTGAIDSHMLQQTTHSVRVADA